MTDKERARLRKDLASSKTIEIRFGGTQAGKTTEWNNSPEKIAADFKRMMEGVQGRPVNP
jgi:hypothetical protein